ncbi:hypothetical protein [Neisseria sp. CCUG12390]|uniref:hypothetical protein n=1 Tax=Neisseria sp. CCUG12390 TaxID=3392035 RepID=UPI003A101F65
MKTVKPYWLLILLVFAPSVHADKLIFFCTNAQGKQVRVTEQGGKFRYRFGKPGRTELMFENDRQQAVDRSPRWGGIGRDLWTNLVLQNGHYQYTLFSSTDRLSPRQKTVYGVTVHRLVNGEERYVTQVKCSKKRKIVADFPEELMF